MKKQKKDFTHPVADLPDDCVGMAHVMDLLLQAMAVAGKPTSAGAFLDEFTALHADHVAQLQALARTSEAHLPVLESFSRASRAVYKRLSHAEAVASAARRESEPAPVASIRLH